MNETDLEGVRSDLDLANKYLLDIWVETSSAHKQNVQGFQMVLVMLALILWRVW